MTERNHSEVAGPNREDKMAELEKRMDKLHGRDTKAQVAVESVIGAMREMNQLEDKLYSDNLKPENFLYWHILKGTKPKGDELELDTPNGDIEKLIDKLGSKN